MKVLVIGSGGIGSFVGGRLALGGEEVTLVNRNLQFVSKVREQGLLVEEKEKKTAIRQIKIFQSAEEAFANGNLYDLVLFTVKGYDTRGAIEKIAPFIINGKGPLLNLQNGVGNEEVIAEYLPPSKVMSGILTMPVTVMEPGWVRLEPNNGGIGIASLTGSGEGIKWVSCFNRCGFLAQWYENYRSLKWSKLLLNLIANAIPAILQLPPDKVYSYKGVFLLEREMLREGVEVTKKLQIPLVKLPGYAVPLLMKSIIGLPSFLVQPLFKSKVSSGRGAKLPSLLLDLMAKKGKTEIDTLNGAVVQAAKKVGQKVPVNEFLTKTIEDITKRGKNEFYQKPEQLIEEGTF